MELPDLALLVAMGFKGELIGLIDFFHIKTRSLASKSAFNSS